VPLCLSRVPTVCPTAPPPRRFIRRVVPVRIYLLWTRVRLRETPENKSRVYTATVPVLSTSPGRVFFGKTCSPSRHSLRRCYYVFTHRYCRAQCYIACTLWSSRRRNITCRRPGDRGCSYPGGVAADVRMGIVFKRPFIYPRRFGFKLISLQNRRIILYIAYRYSYYHITIHSSMGCWSVSGNRFRQSAFWTYYLILYRYIHAFTQPTYYAPRNKVLLLLSI